MKKVKKINRANDYNGRGTRLPGQLLYTFRSIYHPANGADEIKTAKRGGVLSATIVLAAVVLTVVFNAISSGYLVLAGVENPFEQVMPAMGRVLLPLLLFCVSNWCFTTLMSGEGSGRDIYVVTCYSLFPIVLTMIPATLLSHVLLQDELGIYNLLIGAGYLWVALLLIIGLTVIHNYSLTKSLISLALTLVGMVAIAFLAVLFVNLVQYFLTFIVNIITEGEYRFG